MEHYLHGGHNIGLWFLPNILELCGVAPLTSELFPENDATLEELLLAGPAKFNLHELDDTYVPKLTKAEALQLQERFGFALPLHVMVSNAQQRRLGKKIWAHPYIKNVPIDQLTRFDGDLFLASPELTLLQIAPSVSKLELAIICSRFFAVYEKNPEYEGGIRLRQALSSKERVLEFLDQAKGAHGANLLRKALSLAIEKAASPQEIRMVFYASLPSDAGGYGFGFPKINQIIDTSSVYKDSNRHVRILDAYYEESCLDLEYDGRDSHQRRRDQGKDAIRHNELLKLDIQELVITAEQFADWSLFEASMSIAAEKLKTSLPTDTADFRNAQTLLKASLTKWI